MGAQDMRVASVRDVVEALAKNGLLAPAEQARCAASAAALDVPLAGCSFDSRAVHPGELFFCKGARFKPDYLVRALEAGAACYLADATLAPALATVAGADAVPSIFVTSIRCAMAVVSPIVYGRPDRELALVGITGTKGKTTTSYMLRSILEDAGRTPGIMGSIMCDDGIEQAEAVNTTPEAPELWRHLANCRRAGRRAMIMEVSSQALKYERVSGVAFDIACFLNIGRDHISAVEHPSFEDYFSSKLRIFEQCKTAVVNLGCAHADRVIAAAGRAERLVTVGIDRADANVSARDVTAREGVVTFTLVLSPSISASGIHEEHAFELDMPGVFNVENALAAIACARLMDVGIDHIAGGLRRVRVPGRMEVLRSTNENVVAIVDYAHNELSYRALFGTVRREYPGRKVIAVFGAPGGKAEDRRRELPRAAAPFCDLMIFTEEDPAHERVEDICAEMAANVPAGATYRIIPHREEAVRAAFAAAEGSRALVLLLAKGEETRQHRGDAYVPVKSDLELARELIRER